MKKLLLLFIMLTSVMTATTIKTLVAGPTGITTTTVSSTCGSNNGSFTITGVTGGVPSYSYSVDGSAYTITTTYSGIYGGSHTVAVKDSNGDIYTTSVDVPDLLGPNGLATTTNNSNCANPDGSITIGSTTGGAGSPTYSFNGGPFTATTFYNGLIAGTYTIEVKDANGCIYSTSATVVDNPGPTHISTTISDATCGASNGSLTIGVATGGTGPYTYSFNGSAFTATTVYSGLAAGAYALSVKDVNGCIYNTTNVINNNNNNSTAIISYPNSPYLSSLTTPQPVTLNGTGAYTGGTYSSMAGLVINATTGAITPATSALGTYTVTYTVPASGGCSPITATATVAIYFIPFTLTMTGAYDDYNGDGFTNVGDVVNYQFTVTNNGTLPITNITLDGFLFTTIYGGSIASLPSGSFDSTTFTGMHVINQSDINNGVVVVDITANGDYNSSTSSSVATLSTPLNQSNGIKLIAFLDTNSDGIKNAGEINFNYGVFHYELNNSGTIHNITSSYGEQIIYETNVANSYNLNFTTNSPYHTVTPTSYNNISVANGSGITTYNFPVTEISFTDLRVSIHSSGGPGPGFTYQNYVYINNLGNQTTPAGTLSFTNDSKLSIISVSPSAIMNGAGFTYDYPSLLPNQGVYLTVVLQAPTIPTINLGDLITNSASISMPAGDVITANNSCTLTQEVKGSYDPNDKMEAHGGTIVHSTFTSTDYLSYTIRFENTGTANAVTVRVNDVLDNKLDETSIKMIDASHNYTLDRVGNDLTWHFDGIDLPPSIAGSSTGKGFINFQVKPKAGYAVGDIINNTAYIYFDFNPAIVTNTFSTQYVNTLGVKEFVNNQFSAYPNPTTGIITIALKNNSAVINAITVTDVLGKTVQTNNVNNANTTVDLSQLSKGLYFVKIQAEGQVSTLKVIKE